MHSKGACGTAPRLDVDFLRVEPKKFGSYLLGMVDADAFFTASGGRDDDLFENSAESSGRAAEAWIVGWLAQPKTT
jgi:hypothetical protein